MTRRSALQALGGAATMPGVAWPASCRWTAAWDRVVIHAAVRAQDAQFDPSEKMLLHRLGGQYRWGTNLRNRDAHPTRESLEYALLLLEAGGRQRQQRAWHIIERTLALQDTDPTSPWYGLWGYYLEEPPPRMSPADRNWADFNGAVLLVIHRRHVRKIPAALGERIHSAIRHAAYSVRRRNVPMTYTNIAVKGTFVTLAAAELLEDRELLGYALDRLRRFARTVDETGSFAEYNSPTYAQVTIANLTRIRMFIEQTEIMPLVERIHYRAWLHLGRRWHPPTRQLAGPMSRCYDTDISAPLWLQKALEGRLLFASLEQIRRGGVAVDGEVGVLDYRCPAGLQRLFLEFLGPRQHRELFRAAEPPVRPVQGTTWLHPAFCLGTANRSHFWVQRRPLLAYWGGGDRARYLRLRFLKDEDDFSSALFYSAQEKNYVLGLVNFRSDESSAAGAFQASRLRLRFDIAGAKAPAFLLDGERVSSLPQRVAAQSQVTVDAGGVYLWLAPRAAAFGEHSAELSLATEDEMITISLELASSSEPSWIRWSEARPAFAAFTLAVAEAQGALEDFHRACAVAPFSIEPREPDRVELRWRTPAGELGVSGGTRTGPLAEQDRRFADRLNGAAIPLIRLDEERLLGPQQLADPQRPQTG